LVETSKRLRESRTGEARHAVSKPERPVAWRLEHTILVNREEWLRKKEGRVRGPP
jgi:hypothetical protein